MTDKELIAKLQEELRVLKNELAEKDEIISELRNDLSWAESARYYTNDGDC